MRAFQRISSIQAERDGLTEQEFESITIPTRATINSAGYDFRTLRDVTIPPGKAVKVPTGIRAYMLDDEVLSMHIRSSLGFKRNVRLSNSTGIVDSDYFYAENEGHIWVALYNDGDEDVFIAAGDKVAQGVFSKFLTTGDVVGEMRTGGFGSTD